MFPAEHFRSTSPLSQALLSSALGRQSLIPFQVLAYLSIALALASSLSQAALPCSYSAVAESLARSRQLATALYFFGTSVVGVHLAQQGHQHLPTTKSCAKSRRKLAFSFLSCSAPSPTGRCAARFCLRASAHTCRASHDTRHQRILCCSNILEKRFPTLVSVSSLVCELN